MRVEGGGEGRGGESNRIESREFCISLSLGSLLSVGVSLTFSLLSLSLSPSSSILSSDEEEDRDVERIVSKAATHHKMKKSVSSVN